MRGGFTEAYARALFRKSDPAFMKLQNEIAVAWHARSAYLLADELLGRRHRGAGEGQADPAVGDEWAPTLQYVRQWCQRPTVSLVQTRGAEAGRRVRCGCRCM